MKATATPFALQAFIKTTTLAKGVMKTAGLVQEVQMQSALTVEAKSTTTEESVWKNVQKDLRVETTNAKLPAKHLAKHAKMKQQVSVLAALLITLTCTMTTAFLSVQKGTTEKTEPA